ncbi:MAG: hypothetical protein IMZ71_02395, partial [Chloroflexi bacterium]|nr:hypothetical protein [Chloroflexota bacterium]
MTAVARAIQKEILRLSKLGMSSHTRALAITEKELVRLYKRTSNEISRILGAIKDVDTKAWLKRAQSEISSEIVRLTGKTQDIVGANLSREIERGMVKADGAIRLSAPKGYVTAALTRDSPAFNSIYHEAVRALYGGTDSAAIYLSPRIWDIESTTLNAIQKYLGDSMLMGTPQSEVVQQVRAFLLMPNVDMRTRVWRQFFRDNPPGRGVYRSAYKNVERILRTESNRAYRTAVNTTSAANPNIIGMKWTLSEAHPEPDVCLAGWERVTTIRGMIPIADVKVGDLVLTHRGRYRFVLRKMERTIRDEQIVVIACRTAQGRIQTLVATPNHPVLSVEGWIAVGQLKIGMPIVDSHAEHGEVGHRLRHDAYGKTLRDSAGNGPSQRSESVAVARYDGGRPSPRRQNIAFRDGCAPMRRLDDSIENDHSQESHLANLGFPNLVSIQISDDGNHRNDGTAQGGVSQSLDCLSQSWKDDECISANKKFAMHNRGEKPLNMLDMFRIVANGAAAKGDANVPRGLSGNSQQSKNVDARMLSLKRVHDSIRRKHISFVIWPDPHKHGCKSVTLQNGMDVQDWEESLSRSVRICGSYINHKVPFGNMQVVVAQMVKVKKLTVHNLEIAEDNSYIASGITVHNCDELATQDLFGLGPGVY